MQTQLDEVRNHSPKAQTDELLRCCELSKYAITFDASEDSYNRIALLASKLINCPMAGISLVDSEYIWIKARIGLDHTRLEREGAFCAYAVDSNNGFFMVEDAAKDFRFKHNELVTESGIRFYAAAPLKSEQGYYLGTIWVMDKKPRVLGNYETILMQSLSVQVIELISIHYLDRLTGYPNLQTFKNRLQSVFNHAINSKIIERNLETTASTLKITENCAVGFLKLFNLHQISWRHDKNTLDSMIKSFSIGLRKWIGDGNFAGQVNFGEFSFAIFTDSKDELSKKLDELKLFLSKPFVVHETIVDIDATVGVALFPDHGINITALLEQAQKVALSNGDHGLHESVLSNNAQLKQSQAFFFLKCIKGVCIQGRDHR